MLLSRKEGLSSPNLEVVVAELVSPNLEVVVAELVSPNLEFDVDVSPYLEASELAGRAAEPVSPNLEATEAGSPNLEAAEAGLSTVFRLSLQE